MKYRHILGGACCPLPNQDEIKFTGFVTGLTDKQDIINYIKGYIHRPYDDLVAEATERNDDMTLRALGVSEYSSRDDFEWIKKEFPDASHFDDLGNYHFEILDDSWGDQEECAQIIISHYTFYYYPTDGHIEMYIYID